MTEDPSSQTSGPSREPGPEPDAVSEPDVVPESDVMPEPAGAQEPPEQVESPAGPLLHFEEGEALEAHDRKHSGPGGEPDCPRCGTTMVRSVEQHPGPRSDDSPFRIRLVCGGADCRAWTTYNW